MKQVLQNYKTGELAVKSVPAPRESKGNVLVENTFSLISAGTEKSTVDMAKKSMVGKAAARPDLVKKVLSQVSKNGIVDTAKMVLNRLDSMAALGYSSVGIARSVGRDIADISVGQRVACAGQNYASHAEIITVPKNLCVAVPENVTDQQAAFVTLGAIAMQGVRQANPKLGDIVAVIGLGLLGQITVQLLVANGCQVIATDLDSKKLELALSFGALAAVLPENLDETVSAYTCEQGVDSVIITASTKANGPIESAANIARIKGTVVVVGAVGMNLPREPFYVKELDLKLSMSYGPGRYDTQYEEAGIDYPYHYVRWTERRNMSSFLQLISQGKVNVDPLITHTFDIVDAENAYKLIESGSEPFLGILLSYPENDTKKDISIKVSDKGLKDLNLGIIGAGNHVKDMLLPNLLNKPDVSLLGVCSGTGVNARALADKLKAGQCTTDYRELLSYENISTVLIGARHDMHASMVINSLTAKKHVFVEKPLCLTIEELEEISSVYNEVANEGVKLLVGFNRRFSSHASKVKAFFSERKSPLVMTYRVNAGAIPKDHWIQDLTVGGGRIIGEACHFVDLMQYIVGAIPTQVVGLSIDEHYTGITEDQSVLVFKFSDGSIGNLIYAAGGDSGVAKEKFECFGDGKSASIDDYKTTLLYENGKVIKHHTSKVDKGFKQEMDAFVNMVTSNEIAIPYKEIEAVSRVCITAVEVLAAS
jgi:predicted dehydrogenase/threonine dehydrogenase-like Zn-dependent dehydrogenase